MGYLNYEFFDEFKALDNLCRDNYGESIDNKLGVTLYLEDMDRPTMMWMLNSVHSLQVKCSRLKWFSIPCRTIFED